MLDEKFLSELWIYVEKHMEISASPLCQAVRSEERIICEDFGYGELEDYIKDNRKPTFKQVLFGFIDGRRVTDSDVYKKADIDRRHFSKIRSNPEYKVSKSTAVALALALELNMEEADELLSAAGYSLSDCDTFDLVIQFCIEKRVYDVHSVNEALDYFSLQPLCGIAE
jgi:hypothetical protein